MDNKFNIIVPVYRQLAHFEEVSLLALFRNAKNRDNIWFILPDDDSNTLNKLTGFLSSQGILGGEYHIKFFSAEYFVSKNTYSRLLLTKEFYDTWLEMGYVKSFIYQTDCYLFRDEFEKWANTEYEYIGAPIIATNSDWGYNGNYVGNGGFSMRDNRKFSYIMDRSNDIWVKYKDALENTILEKNSDYKYIDFEDIFICRLLSKYVYIDIPSAKKAAEFAYDRNPSVCASVYGVKCPMCAHNFMLLYAYWTDYIPELKTDNELIKAAEETVNKWNKTYHPEEHGRQY